MIKYLKKTNSIYKQIKSGILDKLPKEADTDFAKSIVNQYIVLVLYSDIETQLTNILKEKLKTDNDYINSYFEKMPKLHRGLKPEDLKSLLKGFNISKEKLSFLDDGIENYDISIFKDFLNFRHGLAHNYNDTPPKLNICTDIIKIIEISDNILDNIDNLF